MTKLYYIHDPLCGWCFGFIPTIEHFAKMRPDVQIDLIPGGLVTGDKIAPYSNMLEYISTAAPKMAEITGQSLGEPFFEMMRQEDTPLCNSAPPSQAILQMKNLASASQVLRFAHALQNAHFREGKDLNLPATYETICTELELPQLDTTAIVESSEQSPLVAASYERSRQLGVSSYPTCLVLSDDEQQIGQISGVYDPGEFLAQFRAFEKGDRTSTTTNHRS